jgi:endoglucanase
MKLLHELCAVPTAPFVEHRVIAFVERFVAARPKLRLQRDRFGNLLIALTSSSKSPRWVFAAHMDHPGFMASRMAGPKTLLADFRGGVLAEYFKGSRVRFFDGQTEIAGVVTRAQTGKNRSYPESAMLRVERPVTPGSPGMWDLTPGRIQGGKFFSRVCDDLAGAAAALEMLDRLVRKPPPVPVAVLLTRAEEEGFVGAMAAATEPKLLRKSDRIIAIECSAEQPFAPQGKGAIVRVGDRTSIFHSGLTWFISQQAEKLKASDKQFLYQRALMPGGTCEATVYDIYGFTAASICIALGNYHNMDRAKKKIAAEYVDLRDWENMTKLFVAVARNGHRYEAGFPTLKRRLETRFKKLRKLL